MLDFSRLSNSFSGLKLSLLNRSTEKRFVTPPLTPTNDGIKPRFSRSISFEGISPLFFLAFLDLVFYTRFVLTLRHRVPNSLRPPLPLGRLLRLQGLGAPQHHPRARA